MGIETQYETIFRFLGYFPGVPIFFTVSGFLITASWCRKQNIKEYARNRFLRIYPALYACFFLTFAMLIYVGLITKSNIFSSQSLLWYFFSLFTIYPNITPPMLKNLATGDPNGSLWTLPIELQFYIILPLLLALVIKREGSLKWSLFLLPVLSALLYAYKPSLSTMFVNPIFWKFVTCSVFVYFWNFFVGMGIYLCWQEIDHLFVGKALYWLFIYALTFVLFYFIRKIGGGGRSKSG